MSPQQSPAGTPARTALLFGPTDRTQPDLRMGFFLPGISSLQRLTAGEDNSVLGLLRSQSVGG